MLHFQLVIAILLVPSRLSVKVSLDSVLALMEQVVDSVISVCVVLLALSLTVSLAESVLTTGMLLSAVLAVSKIYDWKMFIYIWSS